MKPSRKKSPPRPAKGAPKARLYWLDSRCSMYAGTLILQPKQYGPALDSPVHVLPASPEDYERMVEVGARAIFWEGARNYHYRKVGTAWVKLSFKDKEYWRTRARAVLFSLGLCPAGGREKTL